MSDQFDPNVPVPEAFIKGPYSVVKGQKKALGAGAGAFGVFFFAGWLASVVLPWLIEKNIPIPVEISTPAGMGAFIVYVYALVKDKLMMIDKWPRILS